MSLTAVLRCMQFDDITVHGSRSSFRDWRAEAAANIHSMYARTKRQGVPEAERKAQDAQSDEMRRLKAELKRVTEERDILKKAESGCGFARIACCYCYCYCCCYCCCRNTLP